MKKNGKCGPKSLEPTQLLSSRLFIVRNVASKVASVQYALLLTLLNQMFEGTSPIFCKSLKPVYTLKGGIKNCFFFTFCQKGRGFRPIPKILIRKYSDFLTKGGGALTQPKRVLSEKLRFFDIIYQKRGVLY